MFCSFQLGWHVGSCYQYYRRVLQNGHYEEPFPLPLVPLTCTPGTAPAKAGVQRTQFGASVGGLTARTIRLDRLDNQPWASVNLPGSRENSNPHFAVRAMALLERGSFPGLSLNTSKYFREQEENDGACCPPTEDADNDGLRRRDRKPDQSRET